MRKTIQRGGLSTVFLATLAGSTACGRPPTLSITAETLPAQAQSLSVRVTRTVPGVGEQASAEPPSTYELPQPTPSRQSFLLRLPTGFSDTLNISVAAFSAPDGAGCLLRQGFASRTFVPQPYDDAWVLPLDTDPGDRDCESAPATVPRLISATPRVVGTAGGERFVLHGWGFAPGADVFFDDNKLSDVRVSSSFELSAVTAARSTPGSIRLRLIQPGGAAAERSDLLRYRFSNPAFTAQPSVSAPYPLSAIVYGDIDGDGLYDVLLSPQTGNRLTSILLTQQFATSYSIGGVGSPGPVTPALLADLDRDGRLDLVTGYRPSKDIQTRRNSGAGAIFEGALSYPVAAEPTFLQASDLDGDGAEDVIALSEIGRALYVLPNDRTGRLGASKTTALTSTTSPFAVASVDVNLDGHNDLVIIDRGQAVTRSLLNNATSPGTFSTQDTVALVTTLSGPASSVVDRDLDGDGHADVLLTIESKSELLIAYSRPSLVSISGPIPVCAMPRLSTAADLDADGVPELLVACGSDAQVQVLQNRGGNTYQEITRVAVPPSLGSVIGLVAVEFDGDGRTDIAVSGTVGFGLLRNESR